MTSNSTIERSVAEKKLMKNNLFEMALFEAVFNDIKSELICKDCNKCNVGVDTRFSGVKLKLRLKCTTRDSLTNKMCNTSKFWTDVAPYLGIQVTGLKNYSEVAEACPFFLPGIENRRFSLDTYRSEVVVLLKSNLKLSPKKKPTPDLLEYLKECQPMVDHLCQWVENYNSPAKRAPEVDPVESGLIKKRPALSLEEYRRKTTDNQSSLNKVVKQHPKLVPTSSGQANSSQSTSSPIGNLLVRKSITNVGNGQNDPIVVSSQVDNVNVTEHEVEPLSFPTVSLESDLNEDEVDSNLVVGQGHPQNEHIEIEFSDNQEEIGIDMFAVSHKPSFCPENVSVVSVDSQNEDLEDIAYDFGPGVSQATRLVTSPVKTGLSTSTGESVSIMELESVVHNQSITLSHHTDVLTKLEKSVGILASHIQSKFSPNNALQDEPSNVEVDNYAQTRGLHIAHQSVLEKLRAPATTRDSIRIHHAHPNLVEVYVKDMNIRNQQNPNGYAWRDLVGQLENAGLEKGKIINCAHTGYGVTEFVVNASFKTKFLDFIESINFTVVKDYNPGTPKRNESKANAIGGYIARLHNHLKETRTPMVKSYFEARLVKALSKFDETNSGENSGNVQHSNRDFQASTPRFGNNISSIGEYVAETSNLEYDF